MEHRSGGAGSELRLLPTAAPPGLPTLRVHTVPVIPYPASPALTAPGPPTRSPTSPPQTRRRLTSPNKATSPKSNRIPPP
eukprot:163421-Chlamydomonas_euryale.AAC.1